MANDSVIGKIPEHWETVTLGGVCSRGGGSIQTGPFGSQLHASDYVQVGVPSIMPTNIGDNRIVEEGIVRVAEADANRLSKHRVIAGDIIYSRRGDVEKRALIRDKESGWLCGTGCLKVRFGTGVVDPVYASFLLGHENIRRWIVRHAVGATMPNLNTSIMSAVPFVLPPISEQRAIAHILGTLDDKIELNRQMNETLEEMARAVFKSWFVDFDPVRAKAEGRQPTGMDAATAALFPNRFVDSQLGEIPEGWQCCSLLAVVNLLSGGTPKTSEPSYWGGAIPWVSAKDVSQCGTTFLITTDRTITPDGLEGSSTKMIPRYASVVVARGATTGRFSMLAEAMAMNQTCYAITPRDGRTPFFVNGLLHQTVRQLIHAAHGSVFDTITTKTFENSRSICPSPSVRDAYESQVEHLFLRIVANLRESALLAEMRDTLLPKLISGELRTLDAEKLIGDAV